MSSIVGLVGEGAEAGFEGEGGGLDRGERPEQVVLLADRAPEHAALDQLAMTADHGERGSQLLDREVDRLRVKTRLLAWRCVFSDRHHQVNRSRAIRPDTSHGSARAK